MDTEALVPGFEGIYATFAPRIQRYLTRLLGPEEADDAAQEVFEKVSRSLATFRGDSGLSTWIYRIARNTAWDRLRARAARERALEAAADGHEPGAGRERGPSAGFPEPEEALARGEMAACIQELIADLPEPYRTVLVLKDIEGLANRAIAERLGVSVAAAKIRLHRARARLRRELDDHCTFDRDRERGLVCAPKPASPTAPGRR